MMTRQKRSRVFRCVDDNGETCMQLTSLLKQAGGAVCDIISARDTRSARWWAGNERFDLYILGGELSDGTGLELCRKIREFDPHTPVIFYAEDA